MSGSWVSSSLEQDGALVALLRSQPGGRSWPELTAMLLESGDASSVLEELQPTSLIPSPEHEELLRAARADVASWRAQGLDLVSILDPRYPAALREIHQAPPFLFAAGDLRAHDAAVSVVGSRKASPRGLEMAGSVARALVAMDVAVIAGLAVGIDTAAHRAALDSNGRTVAFIATGIRKQYPAVNRDLHTEIAERGLLLSQFWPDAPPQKHTFLMRNATMSGYGLATIVVEAGEFSGARAQARMAVEHGRPVLLSELVVQATAWGKAMVGRPGVTVVTSLAHVEDTVEAIRTRAKRIDSTLGALSAI